VIACGGKLLEVSLELTNGGGRARNVGRNSLDVSGGVMIQLVP
jgi:hypothetical protein